MDASRATRYAPLVLRLGLGAVILWFGLNELMSPQEWIGWVPGWAVALTGLTPLTIVYLNGFVEVVLGAMLALGVFTRYAAILLFLHMLLITFDIGLTAIGVRDFGLSMALLALALEESDPYALIK